MGIEMKAFVLDGIEYRLSQTPTGLFIWTTENDARVGGLFVTEENALSFIRLMKYSWASRFRPIIQKTNTAPSHK